MENINENPIVEEATQEAPVFEAPVFEEPILEAPVAEEPVFEEPAIQEPVVEHVEETPVVEEVHAPVHEEAIQTPEYSAPEEVQALGSVAEGVIGATTAPRSPEKKKSAKSAEKKETVAIHSTKNVTWSGVGKVYRGYNIVEKDAAEQWLTRSHIRPASPEEVAKEFGK
jgi:hypothetical protein